MEGVNVRHDMMYGCIFADVFVTRLFHDIKQFNKMFITVLDLLN